MTVKMNAKQEAAAMEPPSWKERMRSFQDGGSIAAASCLAFILTVIGKPPVRYILLLNNIPIN